ncbi:Hydrophobin 2 [Mycena venus]|uniref:Hydrophobin n=1 Tax=Mycena venus TaxID=2733690 RepID=A0A8H6YWI8_9AGAR|nr:Hydrophobin 2 [Mycena venus]
MFSKLSVVVSVLATLAVALPNGYDSYTTSSVTPVDSCYMPTSSPVVVSSYTPTSSPVVISSYTPSSSPVVISSAVPPTSSPVASSSAVPPTSSPVASSSAVPPTSSPVASSSRRATDLLPRGQLFRRAADLLRVLSSTDGAVSAIAGLLGLDLSGLDVLVGLGCSPITVIGNNCGSTTVNCNPPKEQWGGLIAINCIPITL